MLGLLEAIWQNIYLTLAGKLQELIIILPFTILSKKKTNIQKLQRYKRFSFLEFDICKKGIEKELKGKYTAVIHLAGLPGVRDSFLHPELYLNANIAATTNMLAMTRNLEIPSFILASSSSLYSNSTPIPFKEVASLDRKISPYGLSKRICELLAESYHNNFGIKVASLRFFSVYGPGLRPDLAMSLFTRKILKGETINLYGRGIGRDFTHISDISSGIHRCLQFLSAHKKVCEIFNLGSQKEVKIKRLIQIMEKTIGRKAKLKTIGYHSGENVVTLADITKAKTLLGYEPKVDLETGFQTFWDWYKKENHLETVSFWETENVDDFNQIIK